MANYTEAEKAELEALRKQADLMGITYSGNTSLEKLREKVKAVQAPEGEEKEEAKEDAYQKLYDEKMRLIHCRVTCLNPMYKNAGGAFFSLSNAVLGSHKWFVPFNTDIHITKWLFDFLKDHTYVDRSERGTRGANGLTKTKTVNTDMASFNIQELTPMTEAELKQLAADQKATGRLEAKED